MSANSMVKRASSGPSLSDLIEKVSEKESDDLVNDPQQEPNGSCLMDQYRLLVQSVKDGTCRAYCRKDSKGNDRITVVHLEKKSDGCFEIHPVAVLLPVEVVRVVK